MADTPKTGETATLGDSKTTGNTTTTPQQVNVVDNTAEVERLRKEAEQSKIRANQLQNQVDEAKKSEEARNAKQLEEQNEFKSLYEQTQAKLKEVEDERERITQQAKVEQESNKIFEDYSKEVVELAKDTGISLVDDSEASITSFKEKLDKISSKVVTDKNVSPNNPNTNSANIPQAEILERVRYGDKEARSLAVSNLEAVKAMKAMAGYQDK